MSLRVLIVEDEQIVAADLETKLKRMGHEVAGMAASGEDALRLAEDARPEVVLMDIQLQGEMSGIEAAQAIQQRTGAQILFITAYAGIALRDLTQPPGMCLAKPFSHYQLQAALDALLRPAL